MKIQTGGNPHYHYDNGVGITCYKDCRPKNRVLPVGWDKKPNY